MLMLKIDRQILENPLLLIETKFELKNMTYFETLQKLFVVIREYQEMKLLD